MTPFAWLLIGHLAGDFLLQTTWMAENKASSNPALFSHSMIYTLAIAVSSLPFGGLPVYAYALIFITHFFLDKKKLVQWWTKNITGNDAFWLQIVVDQTFHLVVLALILTLTL